MIIGIDLDNTIAIYNDAVKKLPDGKQFSTKDDYSKYLIKKGENELWTELQGSLYGPLMQHAKMAENFDFALQYFAQCNYKIKIISHRTIYPYKGKKYNLHKYAQKWINSNLITHFENYDLEFQIYLCKTKEDKISKIRETKCNYFIDDLISIYEDMNYPKKDTKFILYNTMEKENTKNLNNWKNIKDYIK